MLFLDIHLLQIFQTVFYFVQEINLFAMKLAMSSSSSTQSHVWACVLLFKCLCDCYFSGVHGKFAIWSDVTWCNMFARCMMFKSMRARRDRTKPLSLNTQTHTNLLLQNMLSTKMTVLTVINWTLLPCFFFRVLLFVLVLFFYSHLFLPFSLGFLVCLAIFCMCICYC